MAQQEGTPSSEHVAGPPLERCPNCDGPLRFPADQAEAYCPSCGIFVEVLHPLGPAPPTHGGAEGNPARLQTAKLYLELDRILAGDSEEEPTGSPPTAQAEAVAPEAEPELKHLADEIEALGGPVEVSAAEELLAPAEPVAAGAVVPDVAAGPSTAAQAESATVALGRPQRWHRVLFYAGSLLVAFGGSGLALGSVFHDVFRVPFFGFAYDAFGSLNLSAVLFGAVFLLPGLAAMLVGARAGARPRHAAGG